jgi:hypothetical protein
LRDEQIVEVNTKLFSVLRIERVLDVDKRRETAALLRLGNDGESERGFSRGLRTKNLDDAAAGKSAHAQCPINQNIAGRDHVDVDNLLVTEAHDRAFAVILRDLLNREIEVLIARRSNLFGAVFGIGFRVGFNGHRVFVK